jgi:DNA-binding phage protein
MPKKMTAHQAALAALVPEDEREEYARGIELLVAHNRYLEAIEAERKAQNLTKKEVAELAGLDYTSVRRLLTSDTANPTQETILRLFSALGIRVRVELPSSGKTVALV